MTVDAPGPDPQAMAAAAMACPSVAGLSGGVLGEVAWYLPGARVVGLRLCEHQVEVHVRAVWEAPLPAVADAVRNAVSPFAGGLPVAVFIEDIVTPGEPVETSTATP